MTTPKDEWNSSASNYSTLVNDDTQDSSFLRRHGLQEPLLRLLGDVRDCTLLDVGCGNGWIVTETEPMEGHECDVERYANIPAARNFLELDISQPLPYENSYFDITVSSLVLMWLKHLGPVLSELHRITKPGGKIVSAITYPAFYRTGELDTDNNYLVTADLSKPYIKDDVWINDKAGPFTYYYRSLSEYVNAIIGAGFTLEQLEDWHIDMQKYRSEFGSNAAGERRRSGKFPLYCFIVARK